MSLNYNIIDEDISNVINDNNIPWISFKDSTVLITGGNGFLPAYLVETLLALNKTRNMGIKLYILVRNREKAERRFERHLSDSAFNLIVQDVSIPVEIDVKLDYIIHAASQASPKFYGSDPVGTLKANVLGTYNLLELARKNNVKGFLFFSSNEIYGTVPIEANPQDESTQGYLNPCAVRACYAESKRMGENMCTSWHHQFGVHTKIVRIFHSYGPGMALNDGRVFADFVSNVLEGKDIVLNSDGTAQRAFCYISDACRAFFTILLKGEDAEPYNMGNPYQEKSILELANTLVKIFPEKELEVQLNIPRNDKGYIRSPLSRGLPNIKKLNSLGWDPIVSVEEGFKRTVESFL